jgi:hypothetical protein
MNSRTINQAQAAIHAAMAAAWAGAITLVMAIGLLV